MDLVDQVGNGAAQIDQKIGWLNQALHQFEQTGIILKIPVSH